MTSRFRLGAAVAAVAVIGGVVAFTGSENAGSAGSQQAVEANAMLRPSLPDAVTSVVSPLVDAVMSWSGPKEAALDWQTARTAAYTLHYDGGRETDAEVIGKFLDTAHARIAEEFRTHRPAELLDGVKLEVFLHPRAGEMASESHATMTSNLQRRDYEAAIHLLTPSAYGPRDDAAPGRDWDRDYLFRQVVHEVSALYVQRLILAKPQGWRYDAAAPWFLQGYDEYLAGVHGRRDEDRTLESYRDKVRHDPGRVTFDRGIRVGNPYSDGAVVVAFLHDMFGRDAVQNIWLSPEPTFEQALLASLGTDYAELEKRWHLWLGARES
ncbi:MAG: hypothetical protein ACR2PM_13420 [Hyphomicrobiales bacterium]